MAFELARLKDELATAKADEIYAAKLMLRFRDTLSEIRDHMSDEGDRIYFGSTNDADQLNDIIEDIEDLNWDKVLASSQKKPDLYADLRELRAQLKAASAELTTLREAVKAKDAALENAEAVMSIVAPRSDTKEYLACLAQVRAALSTPTDTGGE